MHSMNFKNPDIADRKYKALKIYPFVEFCRITVRLCNLLSLCPEFGEEIYWKVEMNRGEEYDVLEMAG